MKVELFKLISGEEVIGEIIEESDRHCSVKNPLLISFEKDYRSGVVGVVLVSYIPFSKSDTVDIPKDSYVIKTEISRSMIEYYEKSIEYDSIYHNKKLNQSIQYATNQLETLINEQKKVDKPTKKQYSKEIIDKVILNNIFPSSNTVN